MKQRIRFCTTRDGVRIAYAVAGRGVPLLRVGGWLTHVERDWDSPVWRPWLRALTARHEVARFDIRGSGLSDRDVADMHMDAWQADLDAVVEVLGWQRFAVLGLCQGGAIAMAYAARHPERVSRLVLYNSYPRGPLAGEGDHPLANDARLLGEMIRMGWGRSTPAFRDLFARLLMPGATEEQLAWWDQLQRITAAPDNAERLWLAFNAIDVRDLAPKLAVPTLVFHSRRDAMVPFEAGRSLAAAIPGATFEPLDSDNHVLQPDEPAWPHFVDTLTRFLVDSPQPAAVDGRPAVLTPRERTVLDLVARGLSNAEIARDLSLAPKTVRNHVSNICGKLGVASRAQVIVRGRDAGMGMER